MTPKVEAPFQENATTTPHKPGRLKGDAAAKRARQKEGAKAVPVEETKTGTAKDLTDVLMAVTMLVMVMAEVYRIHNGDGSWLFMTALSLVMLYHSKNW